MISPDYLSLCLISRGNDIVLKEINYALYTVINVPALMRDKGENRDMVISRRSRGLNSSRELNNYTEFTKHANSSYQKKPTKFSYYFAVRRFDLKMGAIKAEEPSTSGVRYLNVSSAHTCARKTSEHTAHVYSTF